MESTDTVPDNTNKVVPVGNLPGSSDELVQHHETTRLKIRLSEFLSKAFEERALIGKLLVQFSINTISWNKTTADMI